MLDIIAALLQQSLACLDFPALYSAHHRVPEGSKALKIARVIGTLERDLVGPK